MDKCPAVSVFVNMPRQIQELKGVVEIAQSSDYMEWYEIGGYMKAQNISLTSPNQRKTEQDEGYFPPKGECKQNNSLSLFR